MRSPAKTLAAAVRRLHQPGAGGRLVALSIPYAWLALFFLLPLLIVLKISVSESVMGIPPYEPIFKAAENARVQIHLTFSNFMLLLRDNLYVVAYLNSVKIAAISTLVSVLLGYTMAYGIVRSPLRWRYLLLMLIIIPFWTSFLIRIYAMIGFLKDNGLINNVLMALGVIDQPLPIMYTPAAIYIGIVYSYLPFMVLPIYAALERMDPSLLEAASDLGAKPWKAFLRVTLPLSMPGVIAGSLLVFIPAVGEFVIPELLGGLGSPMIGKVLWAEFFNNRDWPVASAVAVAMLALLVVPVMMFDRFASKYFRAR
ncbi:ABC transporter permease subunit [Emcibacter sp. SYSU 3D8]|uniref:ABC transporter permease subunit n=1 Tax=Emcibacter sp. SYSU 3D8 TaxID=3133969 RepID=UPI0031FE5179